VQGTSGRRKVNAHFVLEVEAASYRVKRTSDLYSQTVPLTGVSVQLQKGSTIRGAVKDAGGLGSTMR